MDAKITQAVNLCEVGYNTHDRSIYKSIKALLAQADQTPAVQRAITLCGAGLQMGSPRYAYPHIADALLGDRK